MNMSHNKIIVCPQPMAWATIHQDLLNAWKIMATQDATIPEPPVPLILSAWWFTNDVMKKLRWEEMKTWAAKFGVSEIIPELKPEDWYSVVKLDDSISDPYGFFRGSWNTTSRPKPSKEEILDQYKKLERNWDDFVGEDFAEITWPLLFTGVKYRRLLVIADKNVLPPWGTWNSLSEIESERRTFTEFRKRINAAISPHEVDHIDFITKEKNMEHSVFVNELEVKLHKNDEGFWKYGCVFSFPSNESKLIIEEKCNKNFSTRIEAVDHAIEYVDALDTLAMKLKLQEELKNKHPDVRGLFDFL